MTIEEEKIAEILFFQKQIRALQNAIVDALRELVKERAVRLASVPAASVGNSDLNATPLRRFGYVEPRVDPNLGSL